MWKNKIFGLNEPFYLRFEFFTQTNELKGPLMDKILKKCSDKKIPMFSSTFVKPYLMNN